MQWIKEARLPWKEWALDSADRKAAALAGYGVDVCCSRTRHGAGGESWVCR